MDKKQAQFILQSYRPNGSDAVDADFARALRLVAEDYELGEWLARERAADTAFAQAISNVEIPVELRQQIIEVMGKDDDRDLVENDALDKLFIDAVGELQPPKGLRSQLVTAMKVEQDPELGEPIESTQGMPSIGQNNLRSRVSRIAAVAAAIVVGGFFAYQLTSESPSSDELFRSHEVQHHAGNLLNASFEYDVKENDPERIHTWLVNNELPAPNSIPHGLKKLSCHGCKEIKLDRAKRASMVCFSEGGGGSIYLIIVSNADMIDQGLPKLSEVSVKDCYHCKVTKCEVARWQDTQNTYILFKKAQSEHKDHLASYF